MPRTPKPRKISPCPVCGQEPVVKNPNYPVIGDLGYIASCGLAEHCGDHQIMTNAGNTVEMALNFWNTAVKKWEKRREKVISEREAASQ